MALTIGEAIANHARLNAQAPALLSPDQDPLTYGALHDLVATTRIDLNAAGIGRGSRVAMVISDRAVACAAYLCAAASATAIPLSPALTEYEFEALLVSLEADVLLLSEDAEAAEAAAKNIGVFVLHVKRGLSGTGSFRMQGTRPQALAVDGSIHPDDLACVQSSSGTSAKPKAVRLSHRCLLFRAARDRRLLGLSADDITINFRPTHLSGPLNIGLLASIVAGGSVVVPADFDPDMVLDALGRYRLTWFTGGPIYHETLLEQADAGGRALTGHRLRFVRSAGYALPAALEARVEDAFGVPCIQKYGSSEAGLVACNPLPPGRRKPGTCGPITGCEIRLLNDEGEMAAPGERGMIAVRGAGVFAGYDDTGATCDSFHDGFFNTGDTGALDEDGYLTVFGRKSEIINRGGQKVSPEEVEDAIRAHPHVKDAICFPVPHPTLGETVALAVHTDKESDFDEKDLLATARLRLGRFKTPELILKTRDFPRGPGGKPLRRAAAAHFGLSDSVPVPTGRKPTDRLGELWCAALKLETVDETANFSMSGGDSLRGARLLLMIERDLGLVLPPDVLFREGATLRGFRKCIETAGPADTSTSTIAKRADPAAPLALTNGQARLFTISQAYPGVPIYNSAFGLHFDPAPAIALLRRAIDIVVSRHEALRARFPERDGRVEQVFDPDCRIDTTLEDLSHIPADTREAHFKNRAQQAAAAPYDLREGPVARARIFLLGDDRTALVFQTHHIIGDAFSTSILAQEIAEIVSSNGAASLPPVKTSFGDVVEFRHKHLAKGGCDRLLAAWRDELQGASNVLALPHDRPRPPVQSHNGARLRVDMNDQIALGLRRLAAACGTSVYAAAFTAFQILLHRMTGQSDFLIGTGVDERPVDLQGHLVGFFVATLPVRSQIDTSASFRWHARATHDRLARVRELKHVPFDLLVREHAAQARTGVPPLVQVLMGMMPKDARAQDARGSRVDYFNFDHNRARFDITLMLDEKDDGLGGFLEYATDILDEESCRLLLKRYETVLREAINQPDSPIDAYKIIPPEEYRRIAEAREGPRLAYTADAVPERFAQIVRQDPDQVAVLQGARRISYGTLDRMSDRISAALKLAGVQQGDVVGVLVDRSPEFVASLLGVLKSGAAYLALDADMPDARLLDLCQKAGASLCLATQDKASRLHGGIRQILTPEDILTVPETEPASTLPPPPSDPQALAYIAYTSGSTGRPKGVCISHRNILRLVTGLGEAAPGRADRLLNLSSVAFDASTFEIWGGLLNGATLVQPAAARPTINRLADLIRDAEISLLWLTAGLFHQVADLRPDCLQGGRRIIAGGDVLSVEHLRKILRLAPTSNFFNGYGPTENTTFSTICRVDEAALAGGDVPIGTPIANSSAHVLDAKMRPLPMGSEGDLWVGGDGIAQGYLRMAEETAARFVPDPFSSASGARLYKTGDRARLDHSSRLHFLGRMDGQIKLRGYRVELQEIEAVLRQLPSVRDVAVAARRDGTEVKSLAAFLVADPDEYRPDIAEVRGVLLQTLPSWMVPAEYQWIDALPLNASAKVDRAKLLSCDGTRSIGSKVMPRTPVEKLVAALWQEALDRADIGIDENFFELGGHSLMAMRLSFRLEEETGLTASETNLFGNPTIRSLAAAITEELLADPRAQEGMV